MLFTNQAWQRSSHILTMLCLMQAFFKNCLTGHRLTQEAPYIKDCIIIDNAFSVENHIICQMAIVPVFESPTTGRTTS